MRYLTLGRSMTKFFGGGSRAEGGADGSGLGLPLKTNRILIEK
jgi:hypothetical protein